MKTIKIIDGLLLALILATIIGCGAKEEEKSSEQIIPVKVEEVKKSEVIIPVRTSGKLESSRESNLSFKIPGIIKSIKVREGQFVRKGELLASLDLSEIKANLTKAENGFEKAKRDYERANNLYNDKVATLEQLQNAKTALEVAESDLNIAKFNYEYAVIKAPVDGKILKKFVEENELINSGYPVFTFGSGGGNWKMKVGVADVDVIKISKNDSAIVMFDAFPGKEFKANVSSVGQGAEPRTGTYEIELIIESSKNNFVSGFIGKAEIYPRKKTEYILTPVNAVVEANLNSGFVFIPTDNNRVKKQKVSIKGFYKNMVAVSSGLTEGEKIVTTGAEYLTEQSVISINN